MNSDGFKANPEYVRAIIDMKPPTTRKELQSLIGRLVWIRQFIETRLNESIRTDMFSNLMAPINELNKPGRTLVWTEGANKAFNKIKKRLASPPIISPDSLPSQPTPAISYVGPFSCKRINTAKRK